MRWIIVFLLLISGSLVAAENTDAAADAPISLAELAASADLVVLAQVRDTDYFMRRDLPVSGSAYLKILIPYKNPGGMNIDGDIIEVYEKGLHDHECYFPNPTVFEEGRRYLLFLKKDPEVENRFRGLRQGCALDMLVDSDNRYALRLPVSGIKLSDPLGELAREMKYTDAYAVIDDEELLAGQREAMLAAGQIAPYEGPGRRWIYTRGVRLGDLRALMEPGGLSH